MVIKFFLTSPTSGCKIPELLEMMLAIRIDEAEVLVQRRGADLLIPWLGVELGSLFDLADRHQAI